MGRHQRRPGHHDSSANGSENQERPRKPRSRPAGRPRGSESATSATATTSKRKRQRSESHPDAHAWSRTQLHHFSSESGQWQPLGSRDLAVRPTIAPHASERTAHRHLTLLTYNTWSSSPTHTSAQAYAIFSLLRAARADLVVLQEVTASFFRLLAREEWLRTQGWLVTTPHGFWRMAGPGSPQRAKAGDDEACILLVRQTLFGPGSTCQMRRLERARDEGGRAAIALTICSAGQEQIRLVTSHFSPLPQNAALRARQYSACLSFLDPPPAGPSAPLDPPAESTPPTSSQAPAPLRLLVGDLNAASAAELVPFSSQPHSLLDACPSAPRPGAPAEAHDLSFATPPTFGHLYPLVTAQAKKKRKPRRIDRVYYRGGSTSRVQVKRYEHLGGERPIDGRRDRTGRDGKVWASDHEAVRVELAWMAPRAP